MEQRQFNGIMYTDGTAYLHAVINQAIMVRNCARKNRNYDVADGIRKVLFEKGIILEDKLDGTTSWRY